MHFELRLRKPTTRDCQIPQPLTNGDLALCGIRSNTRMILFPELGFGVWACESCRMEMLTRGKKWRYATPEEERQEENRPAPSISMGSRPLL